MRIVGLAVFTLIAFGLVQVDRKARAGTTAPPHRVQLADGRGLNLQCVGEGSPTVILEAGLIGWSLVWHRVQAASAVRSLTRVCAYDRAGMGQSDEVPAPRSVDELAADLASLIEAAPIVAPVVLVGHSLGGLIVRAFAERHPAKVAGLVLVDPSSEDQQQRFAAMFPKLDTSVDGFLAWVRACRTLAEAHTLNPGERSYDGCTNPFGLSFPGSLGAIHAKAQRRPGQWRTIEAELLGMENLPARTSGTIFGDLPIVVLTGKDNVLFPQLTPEEKAASAALWKLMHAEIAALSSRGVHRIVPHAGHFIQLDQPDAVVEAIDEVVSRARYR